nr:reverse transcriptase domain-containing protein [Tanacetum cinerariifolium]
WGQDQRSDGRNGNDRQVQGNYNQRQHRNQSTWDFNQGHASDSSGERRNGNDRQVQGNYNQRQHRNQSTWDFNQGHASDSSGERRSTETLPPLPLCATCGKPHPGGKQKQSMSIDLARLPPITGRVYATTRGQAAKTSGTITGILCIDDRTVFALFDTIATHSIIYHFC